MVPEANPPSPLVTSHSRERSSSREWLALSHGTVRLVKVILFRDLRPVRNYPATRATASTCRSGIVTQFLTSFRLFAGFCSLPRTKKDGGFCGQQPFFVRCNLDHAGSAIALRFTGPKNFPLAI